MKRLEQFNNPIGGEVLNSGSNENKQRPETGKIARRKKSPTEILEEDNEPLYEAGLVKIRGGNYVDYRGHKSTDSSSMDPEFRRKHMGDKPYTVIHTHPKLERQTKVEDPSMLIDPILRGFVDPEELDMKTEEMRESPSLPSGADLLQILADKNNRTSIIGQRDPVTGKVAGYFIIKRTKDTPAIEPIPYGNADKVIKWYNSSEVNEFKRTTEALGYFPVPETGAKLTLEQMADKERALKQIADKYKIKIRTVSNKGYEYKDGFGFIKKGI